MPAHLLVIEARFHDNIGDLLLRGAVKEIEKSKSTYEHVRVPGALEIPGAIALAAETKKFDGYVALGCVIKGDTYHFEVVSDESARGIGELTIKNKLAIGNGIITANQYDQALVRANPDEKDKGGEAVRAALAMIELKRNWKVA